jgi:tyrosyl-DNA phosphodiesterase 2
VQVTYLSICYQRGCTIRRHGRLRAATCQLVGPNPSFTGSTHRRARAAAFLEHFDAVHQQYGRSFVLDENVVLGGDLGWDDDLDGPLRLPDGWVDAWREIRGGGDSGWTCDAVANLMLRGLTKPERRRADRFVCKLRDLLWIASRWSALTRSPA